MEMIQQKRISLFCNNILIPHQKSFISYEYKNTNKIFCRIIPITENQYSKLTYGGKEIYQQLLNMTYTKQWSKDLVLESDYQTRQINDALDALPIGITYF